MRTAKATSRARRTASPAEFAVAKGPLPGPSGPSKLYSAVPMHVLKTTTSKSANGLTPHHTSGPSSATRDSSARKLKTRSTGAGVSFRGTSREPQGLTKQHTAKAGTLHTFPRCCSSAVRVLSQAGHGLRLQLTVPGLETLHCG